MSKISIDDQAGTRIALSAEQCREIYKGISLAVEKIDRAIDIEVITAKPIELGAGANNVLFKVVLVEHYQCERGSGGVGHNQEKIEIELEAHCNKLDNLADRLSSFIVEGVATALNAQLFTLDLRQKRLKKKMEKLLSKPF